MPEVRIGLVASSRSVGRIMYLDKAESVDPDFSGIEQQLIALLSQAIMDPIGSSPGDYEVRILCRLELSDAEAMILDKENLRVRCTPMGACFVRETEEGADQASGRSIHEAVLKYVEMWISGLLPSESCRQRW